MDNKIDAVKKVADAAAPAEEKKTAAKKTAVKKAAAKKTTVKKTAAKKAPAKKTTVKKAETETKKRGRKPAAAADSKASTVKPNVVLQYGDKSVTFDTLLQNARNVWQYDMGRKTSEIKELNLYVKPEEDRVYFVVNNTETGDFAL